ncbi:MAG: hypothetical protein QW184_00635 [Nanopusillaceae archaeon]
MREDIYKSSVKFKAKFSPQDFYGSLKRYIENFGWKGKLGKDYYENYQYYKVSSEGLLFVESVWVMQKEYWREEPRVIWELKIIIRINAYNFSTQVGDIEIEISSSHEISDVQEPKIKSFSENFLTYFGIIPSFLKKEYEKTRLKGSGIKNRSSRDLYIECEKIKEWIVNYFKGYYS